MLLATCFPRYVVLSPFLCLLCPFSFNIFFSYIFHFILFPYLCLHLLHQLLRRQIFIRTTKFHSPVSNSFFVNAIRLEAEYKSMTLPWSFTFYENISKKSCIFRTQHQVAVVSLPQQKFVNRRIVAADCRKLKSTRSDLANFE